jgi:hypothetical protein
MELYELPKEIPMATRDSGSTSTLILSSEYQIIITILPEQAERGGSNVKIWAVGKVEVKNLEWR